MDDGEPDAELLHSERPFRGRMIDLSVDRVRLPNGAEAELEVVRHPGAAAVVPVTADGEVLLVRQYRYAVGGWLLEVPAGKLDPGEEPEACARRELEEETGWAAGTLEPLGFLWPTPGFADEKIWLFAARGLTRSRTNLQHDEVLSVVSMPLAEAVELASRGGIEDGKSIAALLRLAARREAAGG